MTDKRKFTYLLTYLQILQYVNLFSVWGLSVSILLIIFYLAIQPSVVLLKNIEI